MVLTLHLWTAEQGRGQRHYPLVLALCRVFGEETGTALLPKAHWKDTKKQSNTLGWSATWATMTACLFDSVQNMRAKRASRVTKTCRESHCLILAKTLDAHKLTRTLTWHPPLGQIRDQAADFILVPRRFQFSTNEAMMRAFSSVGIGSHHELALAFFVWRWKSIRIKTAPVSALVLGCWWTPEYLVGFGFFFRFLLLLLFCFPPQVDGNGS